MANLLLYGDTERSAALRHEIPIAIIDPLVYAELDGHAFIQASLLERDRLAAARPDAELIDIADLGFHQLLESGLTADEVWLELACRTVARVGVRETIVDFDFPLGLAERLRADGVALTVDDPAIKLRRRAKSDAEMEGIRRAQTAAEAGMAAAAALLGRAEAVDGTLHVNGQPLIAEAVRAALREACEAHGAPAPPDVIVASVWQGVGHDPGSGPLPAGLPIQIDLWPRDEASGCWADMTRTFVGGGEVSEEVAALRDIARGALEAARAAARPGVTGRALYDAACDVVEAAGYPTQRTREPGQQLSQGFYFGLGHGVGLEVHEPPALGLAGHDELVVGDVVAIEPGIEGIEGIGGVRFEDLLLITADGSETLTKYPYDL